jgi:hypothetical protein
MAQHYWPSPKGGVAKTPRTRSDNSKSANLLTDPVLRPTLQSITTGLKEYDNLETSFQNVFLRRMYLCSLYREISTRKDESEEESNPITVFKDAMKELYPTMQPEQEAYEKRHRSL